MNMRRLERYVFGASCKWALLVPFLVVVVLDLIKRLVRIEKRWIPTRSGQSLYIRSTVISTRPGTSPISSVPSCSPLTTVTTLGVGASDHAVLYILATPSEPFFQRPIPLLAVSDVVRAWPGGTGRHKFGGNHSPGLLPLREAVAQG